MEHKFNNIPDVRVIREPEQFVLSIMWKTNKKTHRVADIDFVEEIKRKYLFSFVFNKVSLFFLYPLRLLDEREKLLSFSFIIISKLNFLSAFLKKSVFVSVTENIHSSLNPRFFHKQYFHPKEELFRQTPDIFTVKKTSLKREYLSPPFFSKRHFKDMPFQNKGLNYFCKIINDGPPFFVKLFTPATMPPWLDSEFVNSKTYYDKQIKHTVTTKRRFDEVFASHLRRNIREERTLLSPLLTLFKRSQKLVKTSVILTDLTPKSQVRYELEDKDSHTDESKRAKDILQEQTDTIGTTVLKNLYHMNRLTNTITDISFQRHKITHTYRENSVTKLKTEVKRRSKLKNKEGLILNYNNSGEKLSKGIYPPAAHRSVSPEMVYFTSAKSPSASDTVQPPASDKRTALAISGSSYNTDSIKPLSVPDLNVHGIADKVYDLIAERIKRELEMSGR